jgi:hypothetical protein
MRRYDAVILLQTSAALGLYDGDDSNFCRFEDAEAAIASDNLLLQLWSAHPALLRVPACPTVEEKVTRVERVLATVLGSEISPSP